jgi:co-chaperonin GroES (HSP10)
MGFSGQALNYNVFVKTVERKNVTQGGIDITSETDKNEKYRQGIIVSFGNLCPKDKDGNDVIHIGQEVIYDGYKASPLSVNGESFDSVYFADLVCIV